MAPATCCLSSGRFNSVMAEIGTVYLVGAGPGDPGLITVRGLNALHRADVVVYDRLAPAELLHNTREDAELISAAKAPGSAALSQSEINDLLVTRALLGQNVCRLKGGDPFVFGRGGEEAIALADAGVPFVVIPGITSAIGAASYAGIPVTHRGIASSVTVVTGSEFEKSVSSERQLASDCEYEWDYRSPDGRFPDERNCVGVDHARTIAERAGRCYPPRNIHNSADSRGNPF